MNALIVFFSKFGNTKMVAEAIAVSLEARGSVRMISADELTASDMRSADIVVMGTPTHRMNLPEAVRPVLDALPSGVLRDTPVAAYDTSYKMSWLLARFTAARKLDRKLRKLGGRRVVSPESFFVEEREGPLYEGETERARAWAASLLHTFQ
jgi:flavodoxin